MATKGRLKELMQADINRECKLFEELSGDAICRRATPEELKKYINMVKGRKEKLHRELIDRVGDKEII